MNDATEFGLAIDLAKSRLEERIKKNPPGDCCELLRTIIDALPPRTSAPANRQ
jgi:hypothetical protein